MARRKCKARERYNGVGVGMMGPIVFRGRLRSRPTTTTTTTEGVKTANGMRAKAVTRVTSYTPASADPVRHRSSRNPVCRYSLPAVPYPTTIWGTRQEGVGGGRRPNASRGQKLTERTRGREIRFTSFWRTITRRGTAGG